MLGDPQFKNQARPLVVIRDPATYEEKYSIPRADWDWALRGKDPVSYAIMQEDRGPPDGRPLFFTLCLYMDKFRRGSCCRILSEIV